MLSGIQRFYNGRLDDVQHISVCFSVMHERREMFITPSHRNLCVRERNKWNVLGVTADWCAEDTWRKTHTFCTRIAIEKS